MSLRKALIKLARRVVEQVQSGLNQQLDVVQDQIRRPIEAIIQEVVGGVWRGAGADAFVEELSNLIVPTSGRIADRITDTGQRIAKAVDIIDRADEQVNNMVNNLADTFEAIYP